MADPGYDVLLKLLMVGDSGVGKTNLLLSFTGADFSNDVRATIGVDLKIKILRLKEKTVKLTLWDTAGQEKFRTLTNAYYRGAQGIILVYDVTRRETFDHVTNWLQEIDMFSTSDDIVRMLVANKIDVEDRRVVSLEEGREIARSNSMLFIETSAKTRTGVQDAFEELVEKILEVPSLLGTESLSRSNIAIDGVGDRQDGCPC